MSAAILLIGNAVSSRSSGLLARSMTVTAYSPLPTNISAIIEPILPAPTITMSFMPPPKDRRLFFAKCPANGMGNLRILTVELRHNVGVHRRNDGYDR